jgi:hypothetical protein
MIEAVLTSETLVNCYQTARRYNPEDSHLPTDSRQNLKTYSGITSSRVRACRGLSQGNGN